MTDNTIRWLHLIDLHVGAKRQDGLWPNFKKKFLAALEQNRKDFGPCNLVLFTGDLAHKGTREQYEKLDGIFKDIWRVFEKRKCNPQLLAVPGNHDLQRPASARGTVVALEDCWNHETVRNNFWEEEDGEYRQFVSTAFADYQKWLSNTPADRCLQHSQSPELRLEIRQNSNRSLTVLGYLTLVEQQDPETAIHLILKGRPGAVPAWEAYHGCRHDLVTHHRQAIERLAYEFFEQGVPGDADAHWRQAQAQILQSVLWGQPTGT